MPNPVLAATEATFRSIEGNIDRFIKLHLSEYLDPARHRMAKFLGAGPEEIVFVPSCSHGLNTVLRNLLWNKGDIIIGGKHRLFSSANSYPNFSLDPQQRRPTVP